jgi:glycosyltransferase involved in cell wall biosynthesis
VRILGEHRREPFDVLHGLWADEPGALAVIAGRLTRVPSVVSLMGGELIGLADIGYGGQLSRINRSLIRLALRGAGRVTAGSSYLCRLARAHLVPERLDLLPLGVDTDAFYPEGGSRHAPRLIEGRIRLLHVGSLVPVKDQTTLLRAFSRVSGELPGVHLHIVGDGPLRQHLEVLAASLGAATRVTFHGTVRHEEMRSYYNTADLCVLSSRHESQSMVVLEAAACGRATIGTAVGVLPDLIPATRVVPVADDHALAEALTATLREPETLAAMERGCLEAAQADYTLARKVAELLDLYAEL